MEQRPSPRLSGINPRIDYLEKGEYGATIGEPRIETPDLSVLPTSQGRVLEAVVSTDACNLVHRIS